MLYPTGYPMDRPTTAMDLSNPQKAFLRVQANSIEGGTTNIMKNILGERVLGLPGEPRADKDVPWSQVPAQLTDDRPVAGPVGPRRAVADVADVALAFGVTSCSFLSLGGGPPTQEPDGSGAGSVFCTAAHGVVVRS